MMKTHPNARPSLLSLSLLLALGAARADPQGHFAPDPEPPVPSSVESGTPWQEIEVGLPPWPKDGDLIEMELDGPPTTFRYFIDGANLRIGADGVVRYTLVAQAPSGTRNLSVEGLRCTPRGAYRVYAYGVGGRFDALAGSDWRPIGDQASEGFREALWRFHLCVPRAFEPRPLKDMIRSLGGRIPERQNMGFQAD